MIAITGVHGNFYSNPFYVNIGQTLNENEIDFLYAQTRDAFGQIESNNKVTGKKRLLVLLMRTLMKPIMILKHI